MEGNFADSKKGRPHPALALLVPPSPRSGRGVEKGQASPFRMTRELALLVGHSPVGI
jgi:hypothetical protein